MPGKDKSMKKVNYDAAGIFGEKISREEAMQRIRSDRSSYEKFLAFPDGFREEVLDFYEGTRGASLLYDNFFRRIFDPEIHPDRIERLISALMGQKVKVRTVLSREGSQLSDRGSLVIMDIIVELEDGSFVDVEMQKNGYQFPAQRSSCYAADMIMRQYNRKKAEKGKNFSYKDISTVYLFVLIEKPPKVFRGSGKYIHKRQVSYSSEIELPEITHITYITLDTFEKTTENEKDDLSAWLSLLVKRDADSVTRLVEEHPEFIEIYREIAEFRKDPKELIGMFSEALYEMDKATERYMIEELQDDLKKANALYDEEKARADEEKARADEEKVRADEADARANGEKARADEEKARAEKAEAEIDQLKAILGKNGIAY